jgi:hypothetical protein
VTQNIDDKRARRTLRAYVAEHQSAWDDPKRDEDDASAVMAAPPADDVAHAQACGVMFDPVTLTHDEQIEWLHRAREKVTKRDVAAAFVASMTDRRGKARYAIARFAVARVFPEHAFVTSRYSRDQPHGACALCWTPDTPTRACDLNQWSHSRLDGLYLGLEGTVVAPALLAFERAFRFRTETASDS